MIISREFLDRTGRIEKADAFPLAGVVRDTVSVLEAGQADGTVRQGNPVALAAALHGVMLQGLVSQSVYTRTAGSTVDDEVWRETVVSTARAAVRRRTGQ